ncbi:polyprenyl synthetase family protein [Deinococcus yavapaiensis]|uniref:Geranylgeranyl diphosphate synthase type II n=1 Tax=Deinococcus yavapaiensis KR-236 TaxID=694435 RepID=A0A318SGP1_9DEIO|nr:polyprenyl synthetase family protein [Deinococcus yavapaiensis]PYE56574.1 geranylgeranyl diphosphate synthase type II [Deinococcus yavapaiensis KR-236]
MRPEIAALIDTLLPRQHSRPEIDLLYRMMRDYPSRGGKGLRSELLLMTGAAYDGDPEAAAWLAAAIELFQNWVLIHDDIEDDSEERRGKPALHRAHGLPLALNAGDALHVYMWDAVFRSHVEAARNEFLEMVHRTAEGQHVDLAWVAHHEWNLTDVDYLEMVRLKTSYYTVVSPLRLGMLTAGLEPHAAFTSAGLDLGAAFQIRDDVLNLVGDAATYGKEIAGDLLEGKRTLIVLEWLREARPRERGAFLDQMRRPRDGKDPDVIADALRSILASNAVTRAQHVADDLAARGLATLEGALSDAPNRASAERIVDLVRSLATREA